MQGEGLQSAADVDTNTLGLEALLAAGVRPDSVHVQHEECLCVFPLAVP